MYAKINTHMYVCMYTNPCLEGVSLRTELLPFSCIAGAPVAFSLFSEYVPTAKRGFYLLIFELFWTVGTLLEAGLVRVCLVFFFTL